MRLIALEEHVATADVVAAWRRLELWSAMRNFRKKLRSKVRSLGGGFETLTVEYRKTDSRELKVTFGIVRKPYADGTLGIPFFSKVSFQATAERIEQFGIPVAIELIQKPASDMAEEADEAA